MSATDVSNDQLSVSLTIVFSMLSLFVYVRWLAEIGFVGAVVYLQGGLVYSYYLLIAAVTILRFLSTGLAHGICDKECRRKHLLSPFTKQDLP